MWRFCLARGSFQSGGVPLVFLGCVTFILVFLPPDFLCHWWDWISYYALGPCRQLPLLWHFGHCCGALSEPLRSAFAFPLPLISFVNLMGGVALSLSSPPHIRHPSAITPPPSRGCVAPTRTQCSVHLLLGSLPWASFSPRGRNT